ncbi:MAG TPA: MltA domain-containing protein [Thermoanaerobaculia bacterium]|nr:MltA domain-containing protein [Thermoanaerobaculia bacterium]
MNRRVAILLTLAALVLAGLGLWIRFRSGDGEDLAGILGEIREPAEDRLELRPARFADLPGWGEDAIAEALPALLRSCGRIANLPDGASMAPRQEGLGFAGTAADWKPACAEAAGLPAGDHAAARAFFERRFRPMAATNNGHPLGLFTGYYEPLLQGSRTRGGRFTVPLYLRPPELVTVDLGDFRESLKGQRIAGRVEDGALVPFPDRDAIEEGALAGRRLELVWVDSPVDAFFLHVQGSGRVRLAEGGEMRVGYAAQNGHPYFAIGRDLIERGALEQEEVSMQSIRAWLEAHPEEASEVMARNASYVFFQELEGDGPLGAEGVPLTPGRSLAVDLRFMPLGLPVWLSAGMPGAREGDPDRKLRRLLVAQDTGGAIRGPVRGDVFWGYGEEAAEIAGRMKHRGRLWVLVPAVSEPRVPAGRPASSAPAPPG